MFEAPTCTFVPSSFFWPALLAALWLPELGLWPRPSVLVPFSDEGLGCLTLPALFFRTPTGTDGDAVAAFRLQHDDRANRRRRLSRNGNRPTGQSCQYHAQLLSLAQAQGVPTTETRTLV